MESNIKDNHRKIMIYFLLFMLACIVGWVCEMLFYRIDKGCFIKRGQGFGPWLPIYGFGELMLLPVAMRLKNSKTAVFCTCAAGAGIFEYIVGWFLLHFKGLRLWDYNIEILNWGNIGGFICLRSLLLFGLCGLFATYILFPYFFDRTSKMKTKTLAIQAIPLAVLFIPDFIYGYIIKLYIL